LIQEVRSELGWNPLKAKRLGSHLHQLAALLLMRLKRFEEARTHLVHALACFPEDSNPKFHFVELYFEMKAYLDAFDQLNKGLFGAPERMLQLYNLSKDVHFNGARREAALCYERIINFDKNGLINGLAQLQIINIELPVPSNDEIEEWYKKGGEQLQLGDLVAATKYFRRVLCWRPHNPTGWFLLGYSYVLQAEAENLIQKTKKTHITLSPIAIDSERYEYFQKAIEAFNLTILLDSNFTSAYQQLAICNLLLELPGAALKSILEAAKQSPEDPDILANLSIILLANGDVEGARDSAQIALSFDPANTVALSTLSILDKQ